MSPQPLELRALASPRTHSGALPSREGVQECGRPVMGISRRGYGGQGGVEGPLDGDFGRSAVMRLPVKCLRRAFILSADRDSSAHLAWGSAV